MSLLLELEHRLAFAYDGHISESFLELRMRPKTTAHQTLHSFVLAIGPAARVTRYQDWLDNTVHYFNVTRFHDRIEIVSRSLVRTHPVVPALADITDRLEPGAVVDTLYDFLQLGGPVRDSAALRKFHRSLRVPRGVSVGERVRRSAERIVREFSYRKDVTRFDSTTDDLLTGGAGVCQDFAHLMLGVLRLSGVPCRYVSGYLHVDPRPGETAQSHAWIEFHAPRHGWVPFDPTHNRPLDDRYVVVGHGRHYDDVPPNRGIYRGSATEQLSAHVRTRILEASTPPPFNEEVRTLDVPVFRELPSERHRASPEAVVAAMAALDQQDQQQQ